MIDLLLAISCSVAIGMVFKHAGRKRLDRPALLTVNYAAAVLMAGTFIAWGAREASGGLSPDPWLLVLGLVTGALLIFGFFMLSLATDLAGMSLAAGVMRVSVVIPALASWLVWNEVMTAAKGVGLAAAGMAFFMVSRRAQPAHPVMDASSSAPEDDGFNARIFGVLALLFAAGGAVDLSMKVFDEGFAAENSRALFLLVIFGVAFLIGAGIVGWRARRQGVYPGRRVLAWGALLGAFNYGSIEFILRALEQLPGTLVFPVNSVAVVLLSTLVGVQLWGERLSRVNYAGLGLAALALVLLNL